jgi:predicted PurR-regulated permease PerM
MSLKSLSPSVKNGLIFIFLGLLAIATYYLSSVIAPFLISLVIAYILNPIVGRLEEFKIPRFWKFLQKCKVPKAWLCKKEEGGIPRAWAVLVVFSICFGSFILFIVPFTMSVSSDAVDLAMKLRQVDFKKMMTIKSRPINEMVQHEASETAAKNNAEIQSVGSDTSRIYIFDFDSILEQYPELKVYIDWLDYYVPREKLVSHLAAGFSFVKDGAVNAFNSILSFFGDALSRMVNMFLIPILVFYILLDMDDIFIGFKKLIPPDYRTKTLEILGRLDKQLSALLRGMIISNSIFALLMIIGLSFSGLKFWLFLGLLAGIANFIPYLGGLFTILLSLFVAITQFGFTGAFVVAIIKVSIVIIIIQTIDGWYLQPYVIGSGVGIPPLVTMLALAISGSVAGISGLLLAVPAAVIIKVIGSELYHELYDRS